MARPLAPDEAALWRRVMANVRPMRAVAATPVVPGVPVAGKPIARVIAMPATKPPPVRQRAVGTTLDGSWDRQIARGAVYPDRTIDLHGHTLGSAHALLDQCLGEAISHGDRVVLLVTGKPPRTESERPHARGAIRAAVADWLAMSRHAGHIAAVRGAHPRHGGAGALYLVLRRGR